MWGVIYYRINNSSKRTRYLTHSLKKNIVCTRLQMSVIFQYPTEEEGEITSTIFQLKKIYRSLINARGVHEWCMKFNSGNKLL